VQFKDSSRFYHRWVVGFFTGYVVKRGVKFNEIGPRKEILVDN
jgi:hypothetical protein